MASPGSALIIEVPEAEPAVRPYRERLDSSAALGIPAHITVLTPFMPADAIDPAVLGRLRRLFAEVSSFRFQLDRTDWFGDEVLWLAPRDPGPFRVLTERVFGAFPEFPPFEGQFDEVVPHLTIGYGHSRDDLRAAEDSMQPCLPIKASATAVALVSQQSAGGHWTKADSFALGPFKEPL